MRPGRKLLALWEIGQGKELIEGWKNAHMQDPIADELWIRRAWRRWIPLYSAGAILCLGLGINFHSKMLERGAALPALIAIGYLLVVYTSNDGDDCYKDIEHHIEV